MQLLGLVLATLISGALISFVLLHFRATELQQSCTHEAPGSPVLRETQQQPVHASLPLAQPGFSFRRHVREALANFITDAALRDNSGLLDFFYGKRPALDVQGSQAVFRAALERGFQVRLPGCSSAELDPLPPSLAEQRNVLAKAAAAAAAPHKALGELCLFSQMRPSKNLAVVALARKLNVTHMVESGRKGGMSALVYSLLGLHVTSVELYPMAYVAGALAQLAPEMKLRDGDGSVLVPAAVHEILEASPEARVAVVLDGPKNEGAHEVFQGLRSDVVFAVFDDAYPGGSFRRYLEDKELAIFLSDHPAWLQSGLPSRDKAKLSEGWPGDEMEPASQFAESWQTMAVVPGGQWYQWL
eukprot:gnl/TRDRNA2_/TRDRNA2_190743_c0_seq1.p1 gnl/TRDRNA2_/TRDRNA2_190743_c0~~gnl/TRDRNA2_/TRDRNA2_190743_c0_seq1.p1  ORF type:complete len:358 (-),score=58.72 gnl/TRDRNA2_/TRDRNA2_190743_c0_seq1:9-1082(-)